MRIPLHNEHQHRLPTHSRSLPTGNRPALPLSAHPLNQFPILKTAKPAAIQRREKICIDSRPSGDPLTMNISQKYCALGNRHTAAQIRPEFSMSCIS
jgi:hypothetical protein